MKLSIFPFVLIFCMFNSCTSQDITIDKIEYASFKIGNSVSRQNDSCYIELYSHIDKNGLVKILEDDKYFKTLTFYNRQLTGSQLKELESIFNGKPLDKHFVTKSLEKDAIYAGTYHFYLVEYKNGAKDSLCFIQSYMADDFISVYKMLNSVYYEGEKKSIDPFKVPEDFRKTLLINYTKSTYLPEIKRLPPMQIDKK